MIINQPLIHDEAERKAELIDLSQQLVRLFGFKKGKKIEAEEIKTNLGKFANQVKNALLLIYEHRDIKVAAALSEQPEVQLAFLMNIQKMVEYDRVRKNGDPYYVHPQSVSQKLVDYPPMDEKSLQEGVIGSLLHDYLEEGEGVSVETIAKLKRLFSGFSPEMAEDLALLTEPNFIENGKMERPELRFAINYDELKNKFGKSRKTLETVIFSLMLRSSKLLQMVVPVDKLDNISDCEIVQKNKTSGAKTPEDASREYLDNMAKVLATYLIYAENCNYSDTGAAINKLPTRVNQKLLNLQKSEPALSALDETVKTKLREYRNLLNNKEITSALTTELKNYFGSLGLNDFVNRVDK
jgi:(p)ppGpp synthase/HD superfamily hydrolase